jgi:hypothetical protein
VGRADLDNWAKPRNFWLGQSRPNISFSFLGQAGPKWSGPGPHGCWPNPATMLINHAAFVLHAATWLAATERRRYLTLECLNGGLAGRDGEGLTRGRWLRLWQRWRPVAEEAKEEENGRGCREERETNGGCWCSVGGCVGFLWWSWWWEDRWWGWWWLKRRRERGREEKLHKRGREAGFFPTLDPIFSSLRPCNSPLFIGGGRGTLCL